MDEARKNQHATFTLSRIYPASPARVFRAFANPIAKRRWFGGPEEWSSGPYVLDFRIGGREQLSGGPKGGTVHRFDALYHDIVEASRIIYSYDLFLDDRLISVSLTTIELTATSSGGTVMSFTEQGVYLDGYDDAGQREHGTGEMLNKLGTILAAEEAA